MRQILILSCVILFMVAGCSTTPRATLLPAFTPTPAFENPPPCWDGELVYHTQLHQMLLLNCVPATANADTLGGIWGWDGLHWRRLAEGSPPPRVLGGAAYDQKRNVVVVYGGRSLSTDTCSADTWEWDGALWAKRDAPPPSPCDHFELTYDAAAGRVLLFGGLDQAQSPVHETWSWDGSAWTSIATEGPPNRAHFGFEYDPNHAQVLLYGGYAESTLGDFWSFKDGAWQSLDLHGPGKLSHFGMALDTDANALYLFGGGSRTSTFTSLSAKTWVLKDGAWRELSPAVSPSKRGLHAMAYDPERKRIVLYGGFTSAGDLGDTWEWDGENWICLVSCN